MTADQIGELLRDSGVVKPPSTGAEEYKRSYLVVQLLAEIAQQLAILNASHATEAGKVREFLDLAQERT